MNLKQPDQYTQKFSIVESDGRYGNLFKGARYVIGEIIRIGSDSQEGSVTYIIKSVQNLIDKVEDGGSEPLYAEGAAYQALKTPLDFG